MAKVVIEPFDCLCELYRFSINGKRAYSEDFGENVDISPEEAEEYGCGDMQFIGKKASREVLDKYGISGEEYLDIQKQLEEALNFGYCSWCV